MESLPLDTSHPAVRDYLSLVRLQVLTPLSLLVNIAIVSTCALVVNPSIGALRHACALAENLTCSARAGGISKLHPTAISPRTSVLSAYVGAIFLGQIGYCLLLVMARKPETKVRKWSTAVAFAILDTVTTESPGERCRILARACQLHDGVLGDCMGT